MFMPFHDSQFFCRPKKTTAIKIANLNFLGLSTKINGMRAVFLGVLSWKGLFSNSLAPMGAGPVWQAQVLTPETSPKQIIYRGILSFSPPNNYRKKIVLLELLIYYKIRCLCHSKEMITICHEFLLQSIILD